MGQEPWWPGVAPLTWLVAVDKMAAMGVRLIVGFAISFAALILAPALLSQPLWPASLLRLGDALDLLTPFVLVSGYYLLYRSADDWASDPPSGPVTALFLLGAMLFIEGHGIHLAGNSISHYLPADPGSPGYAIAFFYDEVLGHYLWHLGILVLAASLLWRHNQPVKKGVDIWHIRRRQRAGLGLAAVLYGVTVAMAAIEGQTTLLILPSSTLVAVIFMRSWMRQRQLPGGPAFAFLGMGHLVAAVAMIGWVLYWGSFPEFSALGMLG